jgi:hypothetical protein
MHSSDIEHIEKNKKLIKEYYDNFCKKEEKEIKWHWHNPKIKIHS